MAHGEKDEIFREWIRTHHLFRCLICDATAEVCHLESGGLGGKKGSDYFVWPGCHEHHMDRDHASRGQRHVVRTGLWDVALAMWWYRLYMIHDQYLEYLQEARPEKHRAAAAAIHSYRDA